MGILKEITLLCWWYRSLLYSTHPRTLSQLQLGFNTVQEHLYDLKLVLNAEKTKVTLFSNTKTKPKSLTSIIQI